MEGERWSDAYSPSSGDLRLLSTGLRKLSGEQHGRKINPALRFSGTLWAMLMNRAIKIEDSTTARRPGASASEVNAEAERLGEVAFTSSTSVMIELQQLCRTRGMRVSSAVRVRRQYV